MRWQLPTPTWLVYVLVAANGRRTYVGITNDLERRLEQHNGRLPGGAKSTRAGRPWSVAITRGPFVTRGEALRLEYRIKQLRGRARLQLLPTSSARVVGKPRRGHATPAP